MLIVYTLTLAFVPSRFTVSNMAVTLSMLIGLLIVLMWACQRLLKTGRIVRPHEIVVTAAGFFVLATLVIYLVTSLQPMTGPDQGAKNRALVAAVVLCGVTVAVVQCVRSRREARLVIGAMVVAGAVLAAIGIFQYATNVDNRRTSDRPD